MKMRHLPFLMLLLVLPLPNLAFPIEDSYLDKTTQKALQNDHSLNQVASVNAAVRGLQIVVKRLEPKGIIDLDKEIVQHAQELGFTTGTEGARLRQDAFPIYEVGLKDLRDFTPEKGANNLLTDTHQLLFPVEVKSEVKSSVTVRSTTNQTQGIGQTDRTKEWRPTRWGLPKLIVHLTTEQKRLNERLPGLKGFRLVSIPSLNRNFLGYEDNADLKLVPLVSDHLFTAGKPLSTREVFLSLIPEAKSVDGSPR